MSVGQRSIARGLPAFLFVLGLAQFGVQPALAQGQETSTSAMGAHTTGHPAPLISTASVTAVPSAKAVPGLPIPVPVPKDKGKGLALPGSVALSSPSKLDCDAIQAPNARTRCEQRKTPPAPPAGATS